MVTKRFVVTILAFGVCLSGNLWADSCTERTISVQVVDRKGQQIKGLAVTDFQIEVDGKSAPVTKGEFNERSRIVILLDTSDTVSESFDALRTSVELAKYLVQLAPKEVSIALLTFNTGITAVSGFSEPREELLRKLDELRTINWRSMPTRNTAFLDSLRQTLDYLNPVQPSDHILIISDGDENASMSRAPTLRRRFIESGVTVNVMIGYGPETPTSRAIGLNHARVPDVAGITGGSTFEFRWRMATLSNPQYQAAVLNAAAPFYEAMFRSYRLTLSLPKSIQKFAKLNALLEHAARKAHPDAVLGFPRRLAPCD